jgi:hypothetical protein
MPIKDKDFGKYKRPGIFIEEIDQSIIELPVQDVLINLVPGFSKKGPFNAPIYITNPSDFTAIYGDDDRRLENKGSFFHKTCKQMLKNGPIWALNLLATNPNRDKVDWQTISVSSQYQNGDVKRSPYESFFNRQDFWERDSDAFLNVVKANNYGVQDDQRLFHITNMGDKDITVFMYKSSITGFDVTAEEWYGDRTKVPAYIDYREWISDYLVTVVVVAGDWSDYRTLSNDTTFSRYFNKNGLMKTQVNSFLNEMTVTILAKYDVSLIPYFKDLNDRDMYIKSVINNNTDKTGLFCTYNEDSLLEADFKLGNLDIIGDSIVDQDISTINFMSYNTTLKETLSYPQKYLDSSNNVITNNLDSYDIDYLSTGVDDRTGVFTNGHTNQIYFDSGATLTGLSFCQVTIADGGLDTYYVINGTLISGFTSQLITLSSVTSTLGSRYDVFYLTNDNTVNVLYGSASNTYTGAIKPDYTLSLDSTIILGYVHHEKSGSTYNLTYYPVTVQGGVPLANAYVPLGGISGYETSITDSTDSIGSYMNIEFKGTSGQTGVYNDYNYLRQLHAFTEMYEKVSVESVLVKYSGATSITFMDGDKTPVTAVVPIEASSNVNATIKIYIDDTPPLYYTGNTFLLYYVDDEFLLHTTSINTNSLKTRYDVLGTSSTTGIVATFSQFYQDYYNGVINNLDYFYPSNNTGSTSKIYIDMFLDQNNILNVDFLSTLPNTYYEVIFADWADPTKYNQILDIHSYKSNWEQSIEIVDWYGDDLTTTQQIWVDKNRYSEITKGSFLAAYYDESYYEAPDGPGYLEGSVPRKLTRVINVKNDPNDVDLKILYTDAPIKITDFNPISGTTEISYQTFTYPSIDVYVDEYKALKISPFVVHSDSIPNGTDERQNAILEIIGKDTNLAKSLADKNKISWRYLVDSFGLGLTPMTGYGSKQQLADLCGMKLNCLGFINMPSAKIFRESTNPSFTNDDGTINTAYIKAGADDSKNPDYYYQFATQHGEIDGRSCVGYFFPYVRIYDNGIPKWMPPSSYAATTYMQKFISNVAGMLPWTICAGITNGRVQNITKTEMDFTNTDLENLHSMNANPIVYKINNGYCINDEGTAQVFPYSSLSFLHSREVLINLENSLYDMLLRYQWSFNTPEIRAEIKYRADKICKDMLDNNAFYDFWNVCDETNNTDYVIDLQMGVLDTYVEIIKGMGIIVNNITILKKGDIQSMGFK